MSAIGVNQDGFSGSIAPTWTRRSPLFAADGPAEGGAGRRKGIRWAVRRQPGGPGQRTGQPIWRTPVGRWQDGITITSAPLFYNGMVITGFSGAEYGLRGRVTAYDAKDGKEIWRFYTIPGPGEVGHETWPLDSKVWKHGGAVVWQTPAVDPELGLLYFSTANPGPDFNGSVRAGDNLFSVSIVAIETQTGKYRWHFQQVHHDLWDYDSPNPVMLFDLEINGAKRKAAAEASKTGWVYILDRVTGEPLIGIEEKPVPQSHARQLRRPSPTRWGMPSYLSRSISHLRDTPW